MATTWRQAICNGIRRRLDKLEEWISDTIYETLEDDDRG